MTRFLSRDEIRLLHETLDACVAERPSRGPRADIVRLLLLTGCRSGEIRSLQWREVGEDVLALSDSKTGPRTVYLNRDAKALIARQPRLDSAHVFPSVEARAGPAPSVPSGTSGTWQGSGQGWETSGCMICGIPAVIKDEASYVRFHDQSCTPLRAPRRCGQHCGVRASGLLALH